MDAKDRSLILLEARSWLGTPYHHMGRVKGVGVDCGGLLYEVYGKFYPVKPYPTHYPADWSNHRGDELYLDFIAEYVAPTNAPEPADIVVLQYGRCFAHGGILTETGAVIHAWGRTRYGCVVETPLSFFNDKGKVRPRRFFKVAS